MVEEGVPRGQVGLIESTLEEIAKTEDPSITHNQIRNILGHMLKACMYSGDAYSNAIENILRRSGSYISYLSPNIAEKISSFGSFLLEADADSLFFVCVTEGYVAHLIPESVAIYEQFRSGHINPEEVSNWLLNSRPLTVSS
ncbi:MAG: hypothetical protein M1450_05525 [Patescibacteria group bacterium]|nr:hypothetical protein [Patescibacteria group bacterium]